MTERPILFSAPMVRALLEGTKTQTRRVVKLPLDAARPAGYGSCFLDADDDGWFAGWDEDPDARVRLRCPYGVPRDRLWVREAFKTSEYRCGEEPQGDDHRCGPHCTQTYVYYAATPREGLRPKPDGARITYLDASTPLTEWYQRGWKPSIHMPRWASRITLEVTEVRVQRLQDISEEDARAEGVAPTLPQDSWAVFRDDGSGGTVFVEPVVGLNRVRDFVKQDNSMFSRSARDNFEALWRDINGAASWDANPWVWAISFKRTDEGTSP